MARNLSWIDPDKLASLLDGVGPTNRSGARADGDDPPAAAVDDALFAKALGNAPGREAAARPAPVTPEPAPRLAATQPAEPAPRPRAPAPAPAAAPAPAPVAAVPAEPPAPVATPPVAVAPAPKQPALAAFQPDPRADLAGRLEAFLDWAAATTRSRGVLVTDAHGLVVGQRQASDLEACMTAGVDLMLNRVVDVVQSDLDGYVSFQGNGLHLVTLWAQSEHGRFFGVLIGETTPSLESIALAGQGLRTLFAN